MAAKAVTSWSQIVISDLPSKTIESTSPRWAMAFRSAAGIYATAVVVSVALYAAFFLTLHPDLQESIGRGSSQIMVPGRNLITISAESAYTAGGATVIESFNDDEAVLVLARSFNAQDYPFIKFYIKGLTTFSTAKVVWKQQGSDQSHALPLVAQPDKVAQILMTAAGNAYSGKITSLALLIYDGPALGTENNNNVDIVIESVQLRPFTLRAVAEQLFDDWTMPPLWTGSAHNYVSGVHRNALVYPNVAAYVFSGTGILILILQRMWRHRRLKICVGRDFFMVVLCLFFYSWLLTDLMRWNWRVDQLSDSIYRYYGEELDAKVRNNGPRCARFFEDCYERLLPAF